jgi:DNA-directed RNA polymerase
MDENMVESEMVEMGRLRYRHRIARNAKHGSETVDPVTRHAMAAAVPTVTGALEEWKKASSNRPGRMARALEHIEKLPTEVVALLALKSVLDCASQSKTILKTANSIARVLEDEFDFREIVSKEPVLWKQLQRQVKGNINERRRRQFIEKSVKYHNLGISQWPVKERAQVGIVLVELIAQSTDLLTIETIRNARGKTETMVRASDSFTDYLRKHSSKAEIMAPVWLPMVEVPLDWKDPFVGGYHSEFFRRRPLVKVHSRRYLEDLKGRDLAFVYKAVNTIQRTAWQVNPAVLEAVRECWENNLDVGGIPSRIDRQYPEKPADIKENDEARRQYRKAWCRVKWANQHMGSKRVQLAKMLWVGDRYAGKPMYFPMQLDFRGRGYPLPGYLNPQGFDAARASIRFNKGVALNDEGEKWLRIHGANCWGIDKEPYKDRLDWVGQNEEEIIKAGKDPMRCVSFWSRADKPFEFLAFCDEFTRMKASKKFETRLPVSIDGSNNALQLISLLLRDTTGAEATNCVSCDYPADIYRMIRDRVMHDIAMLNDPIAAGWRELGVTRSCVKRPVMTKPYAATLYSCQQYIGEWLHDELDRRRKEGLSVPFSDVWGPSMWLARKVHSVIDQVVPGVAALMAWLQVVSDLCVQHNIPISWTTPSGFWIRQSYPKWKKEEVSCVIGPKIRVHRLQTEDKGMSKRPNRNAVTANFVHGLDSSLMVWATNRAHDLHGVDVFGWIHDQAATLAPWVGILQSEIKESAVEMFSMDILGGFKREIEAMLPPGVTLPEPPTKGDFDLARLRGAQYFFA